ncbi:hypothetical protein [Streptomyces enissocaesilis]|uniref:Tail terminator n=1 Tax=Streptomyces enissocaesilis TaxID=332589 RepID=A0ABP6K7P2_9ACTN
MWGDIEFAVAQWLKSQLPGVKLVNELPTDLTGSLPLVQVQVIPGGGDDRITDTVMVDVDSFAATRSLMWTLAGNVRTAMIAANGKSAAGIRFDTVDTESRPGYSSYANPGVRRAVATYRLTCRAQAPA